MKLEYVTITGADNDVEVATLDDIAAAYPFVEFAILLLPEEYNTPRCPGPEWIGAFVGDYKGAHKAMHLCGSAFLGFVEGKPDILEMMRGFSRIQLNLEFGDVEGRYDTAEMLARMKQNPEFEFIIQYTARHESLLSALTDIPNHAILFDESAGRGVSPQDWPAPLPGRFCGYAGGIGPGNVGGHLEKLAKIAAGQAIWIDMESGIRSDDCFDPEKVRRVLQQAEPYCLI